MTHHSIDRYVHSTGKYRGKYRAFPLWQGYVCASRDNLITNTRCESLSAVGRQESINNYNIKYDPFFGGGAPTTVVFCPLQGCWLEKAVVGMPHLKTMVDLE